MYLLDPGTKGVAFADWAALPIGGITGIVGTPVQHEINMKLVIKSNEKGDFQHIIRTLFYSMLA